MRPANELPSLRGQSAPFRALPFRVFSRPFAARASVSAHRLCIAALDGDATQNGAFCALCVRVRVRVSARACACACAALAASGIRNPPRSRAGARAGAQRCRCAHTSACSFPGALHGVTNPALHLRAAGRPGRSRAAQAAGERFIWKRVAHILALVRAISSRRTCVQRCARPLTEPAA